MSGLAPGRGLAFALAVSLGLGLSLPGTRGGAAEIGPLAQVSGLASPSPLAPPEAPSSPGGSRSGNIGVGPVTNLPLPRYVSLRSDEINVRRGPGLEYRMDWVFRRAGLPVRVIGEYRDWRQIVDSDNASGWVYHSLLTGRRTVLVTAARARLLKAPEEDAPLRAEAESGVVADLRQCERHWCEIDAGDVVGWVPKEKLWGVDRGEIWPR
ncbi:MAG: SH3 domain-containing protein [Pseudomonadota bacterium]